MNVRKADHFIADTELQFQWYAENAGWDVAERYLTAVAGTCALIERQPLLGPHCSAESSAPRDMALFRSDPSVSPSRPVL